MSMGRHNMVYISDRYGDSGYINEDKGLRSHFRSASAERSLHGEYQMKEERDLLPNDCK